MRDIKRYYDAIAGEIDRIYLTDMRLAEATILKETLKRGRTLDIGCGGGLYLKLLSEFGYAVGLDISPKLAFVAHSKTASPVVVSDAQKLPFSPSSFDSAIAIFGALNHVKSLKKTFEGISRLLKPRGLFVFTAANKWNVSHYIKLLKKGKFSSLKNSFFKREGKLRRNVGDEYFEVWTRFYSMGELRKVAERYFAIEKSFGLTKSGKVYGFPYAYFTEYIGFIATRKE
ncbi:MAG: class I SAM-dependent methyltransferase [Candidatus Hydrothermarchaeales archaeon]